MARDDWRIRIELPDEEGARGLLERLGLDLDPVIYEELLQARVGEGRERGRELG